ncbi:MAG: DNA polymerase III subunit delta' [Planctomycetes bacterium]|nr:DNA polymerase III subunit delta' [Planctomycetota bacterium]
MSYRGVVGHEAVLERLRSLARRGRAAHAYCFAGPSGIGKRRVALGLARALLCETRGGEACDSCVTCGRTARGAHPDLKLLACEEDRKEISIAQVREVIRELSFVGTGPRAVIVDEAEKMNEEAQNALLKTLEEAPDRTVILLVTSSPASLLPTIRSRCQTVFFFALEEAEVLRVLKDDGPEARLAAALSDGSPGRAAELREDLREWGPESAEILSRVAEGDLNAIVEGLTRIRDASKSRSRAHRILRLVATALREAFRARAGAPVAARLAPAGWAGGLDLDALAERLDALLDHAPMIDRNASVPLVVEDALLGIGR